ncbi:hypothetical protein [Streptomyces sp. JJ36]|uniref:hypothetical protein n=1 Tax=Streptomyces sp. JJ36 TaxID=2736645 RepID=UPI001F375D22|nr:hypothetical protein [Streptomyces sp. JJ36]MCF6525090.1 hypothetical protein [Streptomyces sp. JJ36]
MAAQPPTTLVTVTLPPGSTLRDARRHLELGAEEVDEAYGLVSVDPEQHSYALLVTAEAAARVRGLPEVRGPWANPRIEPFGPPASSRRREDAESTEDTEAADDTAEDDDR